MKNYFELYDLAETFHPSQDAVKAKYYELSRLYHPDRFAAQGTTAMADALAMSAHNNAAYKTLRDPDATMAYILKLHQLMQDEEKYTLPPAFLMEMMELNEAVSDYADMPDNQAARDAAINTLQAQLTQWQQDADKLTGKYDANKTDTSLLAQIKDMYMRKKYLLRIQERIDTFASR
jgi:molecular chaperone HscB